MKTSKLQNLTIKPFSKDKCVIHLINAGYYCNGSDQDSDSDYWTCDHKPDQNDHYEKTKEEKVSYCIDKKYPQLWNQMKRGDMVEDVSNSGYRSDGRYIVDSIRSNPDSKTILSKRNNLILKDVYREVDDYGTIWPDMHAITEFPIGYFDQLVVNSLCPGVSEYQSSWHAEKTIEALDTKKLKLDSLTPNNIFCSTCNDSNYLIYCVITYKKTNYIIGMLADCDEKFRINDNELETSTQSFIDIFKKTSCFFNQIHDIDDRTRDDVVKIALNEKVLNENILLIEL